MKLPSVSPHAQATRTRIFRIILRAVLCILLALVLTIGGIALSMQLTPRTFVGILRSSGIFSGKPEIPDFIAEKADLVTVVNDLTYPSDYASNTLDIYYPSDGSAAKATVFWVHGGGFIDGDKSGITAFSMALAQNGYAVVSINYALAPETTYPAPVIQLGDACRFILQNSAEYPQLSPDRLVFGGDSAGAQIASQFLALQINPALQEKMGVAPLIPVEQIKAALLYCGPYNLTGFDNVESSFMKLFVQQIGWAYFGSKDWRNTPAALEVSTVDFVGANYPAAFITDGNLGSFEAQGKQLAEALRQNGVPVQDLFYAADEIVLPHEYQFNYEDYAPQARECLEQTLAFLDGAVGE